LDNAEALALVEELHGALGKRLAAEWNLPRQLQICCEHYAQYDQAPSFENEAAMTYLADRLGIWTVSPASLDDAALLEDPVFDHLNFYPDEREALLGRSDDVSQAVRAMEL
jgi:HD-like signal output (HDOD) protein